MKKAETLYDVFSKETFLRIENFGLPYWLTCECSGCKLQLTKRRVMSFSVHFEPMFIGDISVDYLCGSCGSLTTKHLKCDVKNLGDVVKALSSESPPERILDRNDILTLENHNLLNCV